MIGFGAPTSPAGGSASGGPAVDATARAAAAAAQATTNAAAAAAADPVDLVARGAAAEALARPERNTLILTRSQPQTIPHLGKEPLRFMAQAVLLGAGFSPAYAGTSALAGQVFLGSTNSGSINGWIISPVEVETGAYSVDLYHRWFGSSQTIRITLTDTITGLRYRGEATYASSWLNASYLTQYWSYVSLQPLDGQGGAVSISIPVGWTAAANTGYNQAGGAENSLNNPISITAGASLIAGAIVGSGVSLAAVRGQELLNGHTSYSNFEILKISGSAPLVRAECPRAGASHGIGAYESGPFAVQDGDLVVVQFYTQQSGGFTLPVAGAAFMRIEGF